MELTKDMMDKKLVLPYEEELLYKLRSLNFKHLPLSILVTSKALCNGLCHLVAIYLTIGLNNYKYVRGNINRYSYGKCKANHSWVEANGYVYDPTMCIKYEKNYFYNKFNAEVVETFDSKTIKDYYLYKEALKYIDTDEYEDRNIILLLRYLEKLENTQKTDSGEVMLKKIELYREDYDMDISFTEEKLNGIKEKIIKLDNNIDLK